MENKGYLTDQLITYLGNKRQLLNFIETEVLKIQAILEVNKTVNADLFSGSGVVSRMLKKHSSKVISNDLEQYSSLISNCYLKNRNEVDLEKLQKIIYEIEENIKPLKSDGIFYTNYAPKDDNNIQLGERVFFTSRNAMYIDSILQEIDKYDVETQTLLLGPLLSEISIKVNTAGVFKGFYKNSKTGKGQFGGNGEYALSRIKADIKLMPPILSLHNTEVEVYNMNANDLVKKLSNIDIAYIDPPYNQHPYGSNYFMLNLAIQNKLPLSLSKVVGIPTNWNRSNYNIKSKALDSLEDLISNLDSKFAIISYSSDGFISKRDMKKMLQKYKLRGTTIDFNEIVYNTYRGSRNLNERDLYLKEYLIIVQLRSI